MLFFQPGPKSRNAEITQRLHRLERMIGKLGEARPDQPTRAPSGIDFKSPPSLGNATVNDGKGVDDVVQQPDASDFQEQEPIVKADGSRYLSGDFWANLSGEVSWGRPFNYRSSEVNASI